MTSLMLSDRDGDHYSTGNALPTSHTLRWTIAGSTINCCPSSFEHRDSTNEIVSYYTALTKSKHHGKLEWTTRSDQDLLHRCWLRRWTHVRCHRGKVSPHSSGCRRFECRTDSSMEQRCSSHLWSKFKNHSKNLLLIKLLFSRTWRKLSNIDAIKIFSFRTMWKRK